MSRVGKLPIPVPPKVQIALASGQVTIKGPKGEIQQAYREGVKVELKDGALSVSRDNDEPQTRALHGLYRALLANHVKGVMDGYRRELEVVGVGYKIEANGKEAVRLSLGFSHVIDYAIPAGISYEIPADSKGTKLIISGADRQLVGQVAAEIRALRKPEPYKGKGVRYTGEKVRQKAGKSGGKK